jgi:hypothetical protein
MLQAFRLSSVAYENFIYVDLYDKATTDTFLDYKPLIGITNQQTNKTKYFIPTTQVNTYKQRYIQLTWFANHQNTEVLTAGIIYVGTKEYPYGLYDVVIYENNSASNLDPTSRPVLFKGLLNLKQLANPSVEYVEYENTQQSNVYITNTAI